VGVPFAKPVTVQRTGNRAFVASWKTTVADGLGVFDDVKAGAYPYAPSQRELYGALTDESDLANITGVEMSDGTARFGRVTDRSGLGQLSLTVATTGSSANMTCTDYSPSLGMWVMVGAGGVILTSTNLADWTARTSGTAQNLNCVRWVPFLSVFIAVGNAGVALSSSNGTSWSSITTDVGAGSANLQSVGFSSSLVMIGGFSAVIRTSPDGSAWTNRNTPVSNGGEGIAYSSTLSRWVVVGGSTTIYYSDDDGANWSSATVTSANKRGIVWTGSQFVVISGDTLVQRSANGATGWTSEIKFAAGTAPAGISYTSGKLFVVGASGRVFASLNGGDNWTQETSNTSAALKSVVVNSLTGAVLSVGDGGVAVYEFFKLRVTSYASAEDRDEDEDALGFEDVPYSAQPATITVEAS
jgi:photosystem II stability/assembly factor-like uncharacterized protein